MTLSCESNTSDITFHDGLAENIRSTIQAVCKLKGEVQYVEPGTLPNDGKIIDDIRKYD